MAAIELKTALESRMGLLDPDTAEGLLGKGWCPEFFGATR